MKKLQKTILSVLAMVLSAFAMTTAASACMFYHYQPEEPECLDD